MFEIGSLVRSTKTRSWFYGKVLQVKDFYGGSSSRIYPVNNGDIQTYTYFLNGQGYSTGYQWILPNERFEQVNEEDYYKDMYM